MKTQKQPEKVTDHKVIAWGVGLFIASILVGCAYFFFKDGKTSDVVLIFVAAGALLFLSLLMFGSLLLVRSMRKKDEKRRMNGSYFLYDFKNKRKMQPVELNAANIAEHVAMMIAMHRKGTSVFMDDLYRADSDFEEVDKPLISWFMLYYWNERDDRDLWGELMGSDPGFIEAFTAYLCLDESDTDAVKLSETFRAICADPNKTGADLRAFVKSRKGLIEDRMLDYVLTHLNELEWDPYV